LMSLSPSKKRRSWSKGKTKKVSDCEIRKVVGITDEEKAVVACASESESTLAKQTQHRKAEVRINAFGNNPWRPEEKQRYIQLLKRHGKNFG
jgi:hypothetical protein